MQDAVHEYARNRKTLDMVIDERKLSAVKIEADRKIYLLRPELDRIVQPAQKSSAAWTRTSPRLRGQRVGLMAVIQAGVNTYGTITLPRCRTEVQVAYKTDRSVQWLPRGRGRVTDGDREKQSRVIERASGDTSREVSLTI